MVLITLLGNGFIGSANACEYCYPSALPSPSTMDLQLGLRALAKTYMDISIGLASFIYRFYLILSQFSLSRPHQVPEAMKIKTFGNAKYSNAWSSKFHGWMSHEWHATGFASKIIRLQSQPGQGSKHRYWMRQSWTLSRERHQQYLLTASSLCSTYTNIPFHHTHPNPTSAPCISSGINMVIKDFHWQA